MERDCRTGQFTLRELSPKLGPSHQAIAKQAKNRAWTQDLSQAIEQATNVKLVDALVAKEIAKGGQEVANTVLAAAEVNKNVALGHRQHIAKLNMETSNNLCLPLAYWLTCMSASSFSIVLMYCAWGRDGRHPLS